jgi:PfaD family protein
MDTNSSSKDIAIIGMACKFPGADSYMEFWNNLHNGTFSVTEIPETRWDKSGFYSPDIQEDNKSVSKWGGFINGVDHFDASFFSISPREAMLMDPQQRLMLELSWHCLEDAGYSAKELRGSMVGVYIGVCNFDYNAMLEKSLQNIQGHLSTGVYNTIIANRISYQFDFKGPSMPIDTACSSSLVAIHEAVNSLSRGDCSSALVGGVSILCNPTHFISFSKTGMLSPEGVCKTFDQDAKGYVRGEGAGLVMLKPLDQAKEDKDSIYGVIKGTAVNHGGKATTLTSPNAYAQSKVIVNAMHSAGLSPERVQYIEAHGTGTPKGDPIEINALKRAYSSLEKIHGVKLKENTIAIGSVKTNIGHLEAAAGIAGLIKVLLSMKYCELPRLLHFEKLNDRIKLNNSPFKIVDSVQSWEDSEVESSLKVAGISSFGFGGSNAHIVVENYKALASNTHLTNNKITNIFVLSAKNHDRLRVLVKQFSSWLHNEGASETLPEIAYTLQVGRQPMSERIAFTAMDRTELQKKLSAYLDTCIDEKQGGLPLDIDGLWLSSDKLSSDKGISESIEDEILRATKNRNLDGLGQLWTEGHEVNWKKLHDISTARRVRMPGYAFSKTSYWFKSLKEKCDSDPSEDKCTTDKLTLSSVKSEERFGSHPVSTVKLASLDQNFIEKKVDLSVLEETPLTSANEGVEATDTIVDREKLRKALIVSLAGALYVDPLEVEAEKTFVDMGMDSIVGVEWVKALNKKYGLRISATKVYDYPTINEFVKLLGREMSLSIAKSAEDVDPVLERNLKISGKKNTDLRISLSPLAENAAVSERKITTPCKSNNDYVNSQSSSRAVDDSNSIAPEEMLGTAESLSSLKDVLKSTLAAALYLNADNIDNRKAFVDMGMDSIVSVEWIAKVNKLNDLNISATKIYDHPNIDDFAKFLTTQMRRLDGVSNGNISFTNISSSEPKAKGTENVNTLTLEEGASESQIREELIDSLSAALYIERDEIEPKKSFVDMGMDSIVSVEWIGVINRKYGTKIPATKIYDYTNLEAMTGYLQSVISEVNGDLGPNKTGVIHSGKVLPSPFSLCKLSKEDSVVALQRNANQRDLLDRELPPRRAYSDRPTHDYSGDFRPESFGNPAFQQRYGCKWNYVAGSMYRGISSESMVVAMSNAKLLSFFGSAGLSIIELENRINSIQSRITHSFPYGMCLICDLNKPDVEMQQVHLFIKYHVPVIEASAFSAITPALVYCRLKGLRLDDSGIVVPRRIIGKCSRLEVARIFLSPPPIDIVNELVALDLINNEEAVLSQNIPMVDDIAIEGDSGGHTTQGVAFALVPTIISLKNKMKQRFGYQEEIMVGYGGGIGTPNSIVSAFAMGADFIFTGSINQCTVESGAHEVVKDILSKVSIHDTTIAPAGDMFEIGAKVQVVKKYSMFPQRANWLYQLFMQYDSLEALPDGTRLRIEKEIFKKSLSQVWIDVCRYKNAEQIQEAVENPRVKMKFLFQWYFANSNKVTMDGIEDEKSNFQIHCGPAMGAFNKWVEGTELQSWRKRHVAAIAEKLMYESCEQSQSNRLLSLSMPKRTVGGVKAQEELSENNCTTKGASFSYENSRIAIVGMSGQFPKASNLDYFWKNLVRGEDCISEIPSSRWLVEKHYDADKSSQQTTYSRWMGVLEDVDKFDPLFFNISPTEAQMMNPEQRLTLQNVWHCIEDAGIAPSSLSGSRCGVFMGCGSGDYGQLLNEQGLSAHGLIGGAPSILSGRIAYVLNLNGPCLSIDTACSSSLSAIAESCNSLMLGTSDLALAGGVYVMAGPSMHIMTSQAGMLSEDGRCMTFDQRANGFVPSEGVGVVLMKRESDALKDADRIYGVVTGWGINQDGKTNGITAPSVNSQANLEKDVYDRFNISPENITLLEAHGTGTKLGDPIEVEALTDSFRCYTTNKEFCALGSVKSNIGHGIYSAGIAGVIKILLCMKHKKLVPSIHYKTTNEHIDIENSPFYVNTQYQDWEVDNSRVAAISSFGFSGTNVHLVLEEGPKCGSPKNAIDASNSSKNLSNKVAILLSAKSMEQLHTHAENLKYFVETNRDTDLRRMAYTLQIGRDSFEYRVALVVESIEQLISSLGNFLETHADIRYHVTDKSYNNKHIETFKTDDDSAELLKKWLLKGKLDALSELWVNDLDVDWKELYSGEKPQCISLPNYPFAKESFWLPESAANSDSAYHKGIEVAHIHPLLHENKSNLHGLKFLSSFRGDEYFLKDHLVLNQQVLSGAAQLEMVQSALGYANEDQGNLSGIRLRQIVWSRPVIVGKGNLDTASPVGVGVELNVNDNREIDYTICATSEDNSKNEICSHGIASFVEHDSKVYLDITAIRDECEKGSLNVSDCYNAYAKAGMDYGPGHRGLSEIYVGEKVLLAKLSLPTDLIPSQQNYQLHPCLLDSAIQALIGFEMNDEGILAELSLPFALEEMQLHGTLNKPTMWAVIRPAKNVSTREKVRNFDIDICDENGELCVRMKGFSSRAITSKQSILNAQQGSHSQESNATVEAVLAKRVWQTVQPQDVIEQSRYGERLVILCELDEIDKNSLMLQLNASNCVSLDARDKPIDQRFSNYTEQVILELQAIIQRASQEPILVQLVYCNTSAEQDMFGALFGLLKTAQLEYARIFGQVLTVDCKVDQASVVNYLQVNAGTLDQTVSYHESKRFLPIWREIEESKPYSKLASATNDLPWKENGIYLITGGVGGIGLIFAEEILRQASAAQLILTGRSILTKERLKVFNELQIKYQANNGRPRVGYKQVDVSDQLAVETLISSVKQEYRQLDGVIHSAGVLNDSLIKKKNLDEITNVLSAKVTGIVNLDVASQDLPLDFFVVFSSVAAISGNIGQADYAAANAFMDCYIQYRNSLVKMGQRQGNSLSINWPYWSEGGMNLPDEAIRHVQKQCGIVTTPCGLDAFYRAMSSDCAQVLVITTSLEKFNASLNTIGASLLQNKDAIASNEGDRTVATEFVLGVLSNVLKIAEEKILPETSFEKYGIDSIVQTQVIQEMERVTGELPRTLLFEYSNLSELVDYLVQSHADAFFVLKSVDETPNPIAIEAISRDEQRDKIENTVILEDKENVFSLNRGEKSGFERGTRSVDNEDIAIIGISGRYPQADTLEELWENLKAGKNCITELPLDRWNQSRRQAENDSKKNLNSDNYYGGFLSNIDHFDFDLFEIEAAEALELSPEIRLFLETTWHAFEDAGYTRAALESHQSRHGKGVGVFLGSMYNQYAWTAPSINDGAIKSNESDWNIANRTSHFFDLVGPSIAVNTACSSSLTAIHLACESIRQASCSMAIAGGVNLTLDTSKYERLRKANFLDGGNQSKSFGEGTGYIPGEGVGAVLLKPLSLAIEDNDRIDAVIKSAVVNHSGGRQQYTVPDPKRQAELISRSIQSSKIDPSTITYIESAANGSQLGDPIEVVALKNAFKQFTTKKQFCALGSVKSNLGHLEAASGISQLSKVLLQLRHKTLVGSINADPRNPNIDLEGSSFYIQKNVEPWRRVHTADGTAVARRSMINSFGAGGGYSNIIVEEYTDESPRLNVEIGNKPAILTFSAKTRNGLLRYLQSFFDYVMANLEVNVGHLSSSLIKINHDFEFRALIVTNSTDELVDKLKTLIQKNKDVESSANVESHSLLDEQSYYWAGLDELVDQVMKQKLKAWLDRELAIDEFAFDYPLPCLSLPKYVLIHDTAFRYKTFDSNTTDNSKKCSNEEKWCQLVFEKAANAELSKDAAWEMIQALEI